MKNKKTVLFAAFRNVVPADFEKWLEKMASQGWHIQGIYQWSSVFMVFKRGAPQKYRFVYDLQSRPRRDYIAFYEQFGWECLGRMASVFIWRKAYDDIRPEAFTDKESVAQRNVRTIVAVSHSFFIFSMTTLIIMTLCFTRTLSKSEYAQAALGIALSLAFTFYLGRVMWKIKINKER